MDSGTRQRVEGRPGSIPLRPELVEFMSARCLSRYSRCSKAVRADVREANAWQLLAAQQVPRPTPQTARDALENCALSRVRSYVRRRLLADALANTSSTRHFRPNRLEDFTFFVRIAKGGRLIWEGDLNSSLTTDFGPRIPLTEAWPTIWRSGWWDLTDWLAETGTGWEHDQAVLRPLSITLVAIRNVDQAMVSLGHFSFEDHAHGTGDPEQEFSFLDGQRDRFLFDAPGVHLRVHLYLGTHHDAAGGTLDYFELTVDHCDKQNGETVGIINSSSLLYLLTYLAGVQPIERAEALETIKSWGDIDSE